MQSASRCLGFRLRIAEFFSTSLPVHGHLGFAIGRPMPGLDLLALYVGIASFLEAGINGSFSGVALQLARKLDSLLCLLSMMRL